MTWTATPPTKPGYYWWRPIGRGWQIVRIAMGGVWSCGTSLECSADSLGGEWYGPLEEPKE